MVNRAGAVRASAELTFAVDSMLTFAITPQVHAFDNASRVETLATQAAAVASTRRLAGERPVIVSPVTLKPRHNPYATGPVPPVPPGALPPQVDPRQMSLFAAGWTVGSLKYLAQGDVGVGGVSGEPRRAAPGRG